jgi:hypothetical protein
MAHGTTPTPKKGPQWQLAQSAHLKKDAKFLERLARGAVRAAAKAAGSARRSLYRWRQADAELAAAWDDALEVDTDLLEDDVLRRALHGVAEPRFYEGEVCGHVRKYNDALLDLPAQGAPALKIFRQGPAAPVRPPRGGVDGAGRSGAAPSRRLHATDA